MARRISLLGLELSRAESAHLTASIAAKHHVTRRTAQRYLSGEIRAPPAVVTEVADYLNRPGGLLNIKLPPGRPNEWEDPSKPPSEPCPNGEAPRWVDAPTKPHVERTPFVDRADAVGAAQEELQTAQLGRLTEAHDKTVNVTSVKVRFLPPGRMFSFRGARGQIERGQVPSGGVWVVETRYRGRQGFWYCPE